MALDPDELEKVLDATDGVGKKTKAKIMANAAAGTDASGDAASSSPARGHGCASAPETRQF